VTGLTRRALLPVALALAAAIVMGTGGRANDTPPYLDPSQPVDARVADLLSRMTVAEKAGQLAMIHVGRLRGPADLADVLDRDQVGSILSGAGETPSADASPLGWTRGVNALQRYALAHSRLGIPIVYGADATHGFTWLRGAQVFPQQLALAATRDPALVRQIAAATERVTHAAGVRWVFGPVADVARDLRWGRYYETYGEDPALVSSLVAAAVHGLQGDDPAHPLVAATAKHFLAYSQPAGGVDTARVQVSDQELQTVFAPPFRAAIDAGVETVMNQHGWVNGTPTAASRALLTDLLRGRLGFRGVTVSDWGDVENLFCSCQGAPAITHEPHVAADYEHAVALALNAGVDVSMVPERADDFVAAVQSAVRDGLVTPATLDTAVGRVLALKLRLGLFEQPYAAETAWPARTAADVALARRAADESITVLRNTRALLPLPRRGPVLVVGPAATSLAWQDGGWTVQWQGVPTGGPTPPGVTVIAGIRRALGAGNVRTVDWTDTAAVRAAARRARVAVVLVGEPPYSEWQGDTRTAALAADQQRLVRAVEATGTPTVLVLVAGRPLLIGGLIRGSRAFVMAYLPGSEGGDAIADVLFGRVAARGKLPFTWPADLRDVPVALGRRLDGRPARLLYRFGAGLATPRR
jgi:beta-glucosidase